jgi:hypothetical protein
MRVMPEIHTGPVLELREARATIAKLQAVVDMTREILVEAEDYEKRTGKTISWLNKLRDAIKEVK